MRSAVKNDPLPVLLQVGTKLQLGSPDPVDDCREQATSLAGHVAVVQGLQMVIDTIQQQGACREALLAIDNVEVLQRHLPLLVQQGPPAVTQDHGAGVMTSPRFDQVQVFPKLTKMLTFPCIATGASF